MKKCGTCHQWVKEPGAPGYCDAPLPAWVRSEYGKESWEYRITDEDDGQECEVYVSNGVH